MKNRASVFLKQVMSVVVSMVKAKSMAVRSKTSAMKTRLIIFGLLRNKKVLTSAISDKIHALMGQDKKYSCYNNDHHHHHHHLVHHDIAGESKAIVLYGEDNQFEDDEEDGSRYPDLTHSLFDEDDDYCSGSVIDLVRSCHEEAGSDFKLEDEIDLVADVFIRRFHKQMRMQKQLSLKRYQEMLQRSV